MRASLKIRGLVTVSVILMNISTALSYHRIEVTVLNDGRNLSRKEVQIQMMANEILSIEYVGVFKNDSLTGTQVGFLMKDWRFALPKFVEDWTNKEVMLEPGEEGELRNIIYIRPIAAGYDSIVVWHGIRYGTHPYSPWKGNWMKIFLTVIPARYDIPSILAEPEFTPGTSNEIRWIPAKGTQIQDLYYFNREDRSNLLKAVQGLYKPSVSGTNSTVVNGLIHNNTYGFVVRSVFKEGAESVMLYSDVAYSTQDNLPPESVKSINARQVGNAVLVSWFPVADAQSGVQFYRIYRAINSQRESLIVDSAYAEGLNGDNFEWLDTNVISNHTYFYRITAVDQVGNEGTGDWSNRVVITAAGSDIPGEDIPVDDITSTPPSNLSMYRKGSIDTLWYHLDRREERIRFQAVRDDSAYFKNIPHVGMRHFDSGWIDPAALRQKGWVSPTDRDHVYYIFNYANDNGVSIDLNFVNNHTYIRRVTVVYPASDTVMTGLGRKIPDCFPPPDIHNLQIEPIVLNENDPSGWYMELRWDPVSDGESGFKRYRVFRKVNGVDNNFVEIPTGDRFAGTVFRDFLIGINSNIYNYTVSYKVVSDDYIGNKRNINDSSWLVQEQALGGPRIRFNETDPVNIYPPNPTQADTIYSKKADVLLQLDRFSFTSIGTWMVSVNGVERHYRFNQGETTLRVPLSTSEVSVIKIKAFYVGKRVSQWSNSKVVIRALNLPATQISAWNNPDYWNGDITLQWTTGSQDARKYEIYRCIGSQCRLIYSGSIKGIATVKWVDNYGIDELTGNVGDYLVSYQTYDYKVRCINVFGAAGQFSPVASAYCNRPPQFVSSANPELEDGRFALTVKWKRTRPTLVQTGYKGIVQVSEDNLEHVVGSAIVVDDTVYTYIGARGGHNYIFRVKETPSSMPDKPSAWSKPFTVSSLVSLNPFVVLPQPEGDVFLYWNSPDIIEKFKVDSFIVCRNDVCWKVDRKVISYMDPRVNLTHGTSYEYSVFAIDSLKQVVAANAKPALCDTGAVYIPDIEPFQQIYFNNNALDVFWVWRDIQLNKLQDTSRGAVLGYLQASVSTTFPNDPNQTRTLGPFAVDSSVVSKRISVPALMNSSNNKLYFRIRTLDAYGHPNRLLWSTEFYPLRQIAFDNLPPRTVSDLKVTSSNAYYKNADTLVVTLDWTDVSIQHVNRLIGNVKKYQIVRLYNGQETQIGEVPVQPNITAYTYSDTVKNGQYQWWLVSIDSADNVTLSNWTQSGYYLPTPLPPSPTGFRSCSLPSVNIDGAQYFVEIAMKRNHFSLAYDLDASQVENRLLCQSGWIDTTLYTCTSGWGNIVADTTWFRVKVRKLAQNVNWESGWSDIVPFVKNGGQPLENSVNESIPKQFEIFYNYPNPFNAVTVISFDVPEEATATIRIFNIRGSLVKSLLSERKSPGHYAIYWDGSDDTGKPVSSGIYIGQVILESREGRIFQKRMKMTMIQ